MKVGDRVLLLRCDDPWTRIRPGTCGTVTFIDDCGTYFVKWDNGLSLGIVEKAGDRVLPVDPQLTCGRESLGFSECRLQQGHTGDPDPEKRLHSDFVLLWNDDGELCNLDGKSI